MIKKRNNNINQSERTQKKNIVILRDCMIMHLKGYRMSQEVGECKVFLKSFGGVKVWYMKEHMKLIIREKTDHVLLQVRSNALNSDREAELISKSILYLAYTLTHYNSVDVSISNIIVANDNTTRKVLW